jgi:uncharacterized membrane protein
VAFGIDLAAVVLAFALTVIEMTEVVALVFALGAEGGAHRPAALGAMAGVAVVSAIAAVVGVGLESLPRTPLLGGAAIVLAAFGVFLLRSTLRTYRKARRSQPGPSAPASTTVPFVGGFTAGAVETTEVVIVLVALAAGGHGTSALVGALLAAALLVVLALAIHERIRRLKVPTLKLSATGALFAFATFWGGEAAGFAWPGPGPWADLWLVPLFLLGVTAVRGLVEFDARREAAQAKG